MFANEPALALPLTSACHVVHQTPGFCLSLLTARNLSGALAWALPLCVYGPGFSLDITGGWWEFVFVFLGLKF